MTRFPEFWPRARHIRGRLPNPREPAEKAWGKAMKKGTDPDQIIAGYLGYESAMDECDMDHQFRCQASKFINQEYWEQYLDEYAAKAYLAKPKLEVVR